MLCRKSIYLFFSVCLLTQSAFSLTLYVSPTGKDSNKGTKASPLASMAGARDRIRMLKKDHPHENIQVIIGKGNYFLREPVLFNSEDGGSAGYSVTYLSEQGSKPVFYGGAPIKGFQKVNEKLWT